MTSAARARAGGVVAALVLCAAALAGSETVPVRTGGTGADPRQPHARAHVHLGADDHAATSLASAPTGLEALAAHAQHEDEEQAAGPSRADDTRAFAQGLRRAKA